MHSLVPVGESEQATLENLIQWLSYSFQMPDFRMQFKIKQDMDKAETGDKLNHQEGLPPQSLSLVI